MCLDMCKKLVFFAAALVVLAGCGKQEGRLVSVEFGVHGVGAGTKTGLVMPEPEADDVEFTIEGMGASRTVRIGQTVTLKEGDYEVTGVYAPWIPMNVGGHRISVKPGFLVADEIAVEAGMSAVEVDAEWSCWALVVMESEVASVKLGGSVFVLDAFGEGYLGVFVEANDSGAWELELTPADAGEKKVTVFNIEADERNRAGKWFLYRPDGRVQVSGGFDVALPGWVAGE